MYMLRVHVDIFLKEALQKYCHINRISESDVIRSGLVMLKEYINKYNELPIDFIELSKPERPQRGKYKDDRNIGVYAKLSDGEYIDLLDIQHRLRAYGMSLSQIGRLAIFFYISEGKLKDVKNKQEILTKFRKDYKL